MPNNYIPIVLTSPRGAGLFRARYSDGDITVPVALILANFQQMTDGVDYSTLEGAFGLPANKGQAVNALVTNAVSELNAAANANAMINTFAITR